MIAKVGQIALGLVSELSIITAPSRLKMSLIKACLLNAQSEPRNMEENNVVTRPESSAFIPSHKRSCSIPPRLIEDGLESERKKAIDIYSQIKTSTKSILPSLSPKFELLQNEMSPVDDKES
jgi:hypothetical protein